MKEKETFSTVQLNTVNLFQPAKVSVFQFGTIAAPVGSTYLITPTTIPSDQKLVTVFWIDRNIAIPNEDIIRFNLRFQIDIHDSINLQIRLRPSLSKSSHQTIMDWRWLAPHGEKSEWTNSKLTPSWTDGKHSSQFSCEIAPQQKGIYISLGKKNG